MTGRHYFKLRTMGYFSCVLAQAMCFAASANAASGPVSVAPSPIVNDLRNLLITSHVVYPQQIHTGDNGDTLYWTKDNIAGSARALEILPGESLTKAARSYLEQASFSCKGQFAEKVDQPRKIGYMTVLKADTACVDNADNPGTSMLFVLHRGNLGIIAQQDTVDQLSDAMSDRDALISAAASVPDSPPVFAEQPPVEQPVVQASAAAVEAVSPPSLQIAANPPAPVQQAAAQPEAMAQPQAAVDDPQPAPPQKGPAEKTTTWATAATTLTSFFTASPQKGLTTTPGLTLGLQISRYKYREQTGSADPFVNLVSYPLGIVAAYTTPPLPSFYNAYLRLGGRFAFGPAHYSSASGTASGQVNNIWEIRGLIGKDFTYGDVDFSPYTGYAVRYLYNDARGLTSLGTSGYRRQSVYQYIPLGLTSRLGLTDGARLALNTEYDLFTAGTQKSYLSDPNPTWGNIVNHQRHGFGFGGSIMFQMRGWSAGPWFDYWHIKDSDFLPIPGSPGLGGMEPDNKTTELGLKITKTM